MKKLATLLLFCLAVSGLFAQATGDSIAYQQQRRKINEMLAARTQKFGQYDASLKMHTGIFGLQTKKDIRRSNAILMNIVKTDDDIYQQLKILFDLKTFQTTQVQSHTHEVEQNTLGYMNTINKLRNQVDQLKANAERQQQKADQMQQRLLGVILLLAVFVVILIYLSRRRPQKKKRRS